MHLERNDRVYTLVACVTCKRGVRPSEASTRMECMACLEARADRAEALLRELVSIPGWAHNQESNWGVPSWCGYCTKDAPVHAPTCPIARARALLEVS